MSGKHLLYAHVILVAVAYLLLFAGVASAAESVSPPSSSGISTMALLAVCGMFLSMVGTLIALMTVLLKLARDRQNFGERMGTIEEKLRVGEDRHTKHEQTQEAVHRIEVTLAGVGQRLDHIDGRLIQAIALEEVRARGDA